MAPSLVGATKIPDTLLADSRLTLTIVLHRGDQTGFEHSLRAVQEPNSPFYRHYLSPQEQANRFGPSASSYNAVNDWLREQGFKLIEGSENRLTLTISGTRAQAEKAFGVHINNYRIGDRSFYASDREPVLPPTISSNVQAVIGLTNRAKPAASKEAEIRDLCLDQAAFAALSAATTYGHASGEQLTGNYHHIFDKAWTECVEANGLNPYGAGNGPPGGLGGPSFALRAAAGRPGKDVTGAGQTIGLLEFDTFNANDIRDYLLLIGRPATELNRLSQVHVNGGAPLGPEESEVLIDIIGALTNAPGANVVVYDAPFNGNSTSFQALFNRMISDHVTVISNSWSYCEDQTTRADVQSLDSILASAAAAGISVFNGSGGSGSTCLGGSSNTVGVPVDSPNATAVGGTSLTIGPARTYRGETLWLGLAQTPPTGLGGFGVSQFFDRPAYQNGFTTSGKRSIPDVAVNADPAKGIYICQADAAGCPTGLIYGGTSLSAPIWAAFAALLNEAQGQNIGAFNPLLYSLGGSNAFHSPGTMGSDFVHLGLGSPNLDLIHRALSGSVLGAPSANVSEVDTDPSVTLPDNTRISVATADGVSGAFIIVRLRDDSSHTIDGRTITLMPNAGHATITPATGITNVANGAVVFSVKDTVPEIVIFTATDVSDGIVLQKTATVAFIAPPAAAGGITANPTTVTANGTSTTTITVTLQDAKGNPSPGKFIKLSQGGGHSIITGPSPATTEANGQIQFTATDNVSETVTYTAIDVTDGNLPVPGSAVVNFTGGSTSCVGAPPTAAPGFTLTPFANGFVAKNFFYSGVNWGGCPGATNPAFDSAGTGYVTDFADGNIYKFDSTGGAVTNGNVLANLGLTISQLAFGKDGNLYASRTATGSGNSSGNVIQIDPSTGAVIKVLASGLKCPSAPAVDPLSGDLFFTGICYGGGTDDPALYRITNPSSSSPTLTTYATLPSTPNGTVTFAPDGTIYVVSGYTATEGSIIRVAGTNTPSPPVMTTLSGINSDFWVTLAAAQSNGAAKSLLVASDGALKLVDITTTPFTTTVLATGTGLSSGTIGRDGCLYMTAHNSILKLVPSSGGCGFNPTNPAPTLVLSPEIISPSPAQATTVTFAAQLKNVADPADVPITFFVSGANAKASLVRADATGKAVFTYTGVSVGSDQAFASADVNGTSLFSIMLT